MQYSHYQKDKLTKTRVKNNPVWRLKYYCHGDRLFLLMISTFIRNNLDFRFKTRNLQCFFTKRKNQDHARTVVNFHKKISLFYSEFFFSMPKSIYPIGVSHMVISTYFSEFFFSQLKFYNRLPALFFYDVKCPFKQIYFKIGENFFRGYTKHRSSRKIYYLHLR